MINLKNSVMALVFASTMLASPALAAASTAMVNPTAAQITTSVAAKQASIASSATQWQMFTGTERLESRAADVAKMNGITLEAAKKRVYAGWLSENGYIGFSPLYPYTNQLVFNPSYQAWEIMFTRSFYAGYDPLTGSHKFTAQTETPVSVRTDNAWYCPVGSQYIYADSGSVCQ